MELLLLLLLPLVLSQKCEIKVKQDNSCHGHVLLSMQCHSDAAKKTTSMIAIMPYPLPSEEDFQASFAPLHYGVTRITTRNHQDSAKDISISMQGESLKFQKTLVAVLFEQFSFKSKIMAISDTFGCFPALHELRKDLHMKEWKKFGWKGRGSIYYEVNEKDALNIELTLLGCPSPQLTVSVHSRNGDASVVKDELPETLVDEQCPVVIDADRAALHPLIPHKIIALQGGHHVIEISSSEEVAVDQAESGRHFMAAIKLSTPCRTSRFLIHPHAQTFEEAKKQAPEGYKIAEISEKTWKPAAQLIASCIKKHSLVWIASFMQFKKKDIQDKLGNVCTALMGSDDKEMLMSAMIFDCDAPKRATLYERIADEKEELEEKQEEKQKEEGEVKVDYIYH